MGTMGNDKSSKSYDAILGMLVDRITHPEEWRFES
jgi:hypothetical protein